MTGPAPAPRPFTWSYSRLKNFETCPKRHWHVDLAKDIREEESEQLAYGNLVHKAAAKRLATGAALPAGMDILEKWCARLLTTPGNILVEQKLAITRDFGPTDFFAKDVWFRGVGDVVKINGPVALIVDWKTGKVIEDSVQLALSAACVFYHHPQIQKIRSEFVWLKDDCSTPEVFAREEMPALWRNLWPRIEALENAYKSTAYPPKPGYLCRRWCPVGQCPHHGE